MRRKNNSNHNLKTVFNSNSHSLLSQIDKKRPDLSKDKYLSLTQNKNPANARARRPQRP